jgi:hypothetical protein
MALIGSLGRDLPEVKSSVNPYISAYINVNQRGAMKIDTYTKASLTVIALTFAVFLSGCVYGGTYKFRGAGTFQEFSSAMSACYSAVIGANSIPQCGAVAACMAGKGYVQDANGNLDSSSISFKCSP